MTAKEGHGKCRVITKVTAWPLARTWVAHPQIHKRHQRVELGCV